VQQPVGQPPVGPQLVGPQLVGPQLVGPQLVGPQLVGPQSVGPRIGLESADQVAVWDAIAQAGASRASGPHRALG
jgi:hypothetical protein